MQNNAGEHWTLQSPDLSWEWGVSCIPVFSALMAWHLESWGCHQLVEKWPGPDISSADLNIPNSHHLMTSLSWHHDISAVSITVQFSLCIIYWILGEGWYVRGWSCYTVMVMGVSGPVTRNSSPCHVTPSRTLNKYFTPITITQC